MTPRRDLVIVGKPVEPGEPGLSCVRCGTVCEADVDTYTAIINGVTLVCQPCAIEHHQSHPGAWTPAE